MAKIVRFHNVGGPEVLKIEDIPSRPPSKGEVTLSVRAIGLNRAESMFMHGYYLEPTQLPATLGYEASGVVTAVGANVDSGWLNKSVSTMPAFSMNQYGVLGNEVIVPVRALAEYPSHLKPIEATSIWMQYMTAYGALVKFGQVKKGEFILITAASSSTGLAAIQIAKAEGAISIATTRTSAKRDDLFVLGADHVIVTDEEDLPVASRRSRTGRAPASFSIQLPVRCSTDWPGRQLLGPRFFNMFGSPGRRRRIRSCQRSKRP
jgi:NADPH:quinone reductase-like Zn-dependent oxidoreductase